MLSTQETIRVLMHMGMSEYEARAYVALTGLISATATEISSTSQVPRSKIYEVLKRLARNDYVEIIPGRPLRFRVVSPTEVFEKAKKQMLKDMEKAETELEVIYENRLPKVPAPIWLIRGPERIMKKEIEIIRRAKRSLFVFGGLMFRNEIKAVKPHLEKAAERGVALRILARPYSVIDGEKIDILKGLEGLKCELKSFQLPYIKGLVRDGEEMIIIFCKLDGGSALSQTAIAIWNQYPEFIRTVEGIYNNMWDFDLFSDVR